MRSTPNLPRPTWKFERVVRGAMIIGLLEESGENVRGPSRSPKLIDARQEL